MPEFCQRVMECSEGGVVARHSVVLIVAPQYPAQPTSHLSHRPVHALPENLFERPELRMLPLGLCPPEHFEPSPTILCTDVRESQEVECLRLSQTTWFAPFRRVSPKFKHTRLRGVQLQTEPAKSLPQVGQEPFGFRVVFEPNHEVLRVTDDYHINSCPPVPPLEWS